MASYGLKYICTFDPLGPVVTTPIFTLEFLFKNYSGATYNVTGGAVPVVHSWNTDDPKAPVKGSSLQITLVNEGSTPLLSFSSTDDDGVKVRLLWNTQLMFEGFLVQDDCREPIVNYAHEISLSANDGLGLLKGVDLDKNTLLNTVFSNLLIGSFHSGATNYLEFLDSTVFTPAVGVPFEIINHPTLNGSYTPTTVNAFGPGVFNVFVSNVLVTSGAVTGDILASGLDLTQKQSLFTILSYCLGSTNLELSTKIYANIYENTQNTLSPFLTQTLIDPSTFLKSENEYLDCYLVAEQIMSRWNMSLFQAKGVWNVVRWDELRYSGVVRTIPNVLYLEGVAPNKIIITTADGFYVNTGDTIVISGFGPLNGSYTVVSSTGLVYLNVIVNEVVPTVAQTGPFAPGTVQVVITPTLNSINGFEYDKDFNFVGYISLNELLNVNDVDLLYEAQPDHRIFRNFLFDKETFNYKQPFQLLRNYDLQQLGNLRTVYTIGAGLSLKTIKEYDATWWYYTDAFPTQSGVNGPADFFIRLVLDNLGNEIERYLVTKHNAIHSYQIEANQGDTFKWSFSFRATHNNPAGLGFVLIAKLTDGVTTSYVCEPGDAGDPLYTGWKNGPGWNITIQGDTVTNFNQVEIQSKGIPFDGLLYFYLQVLTDNPNDETKFMDMRLEYTPAVNSSTKIIGHTHTQTQPGSIKQNQQEEIFMDPSPRNSIAGTLFLPTMTGLLQTRCVNWRRGVISESRRLGDITTFETLFWRRVPRSIIEGTITLPLPEYVSLLSVFNYNVFPDLNFIWGRLEIDYKNNKLSGTLWEQWETGEVDADLVSGYEFKYLYATK